MRRLPLLLSCLVCWASVAALPAQRATLADRLGTLAQAEVEQQQLVGLAVAWFTNGELAGERHFGFADREAKTPVDARTMFRWASISKPVTAVAAMQLWERGKLDLDADVRAHVPEFPAKDAPISSRLLLAHLGGIVHYRNGSVVVTEREYAVPHPFADPILALDRFKDSPLVCAPGSKHSYSTHGYLLLGAVVERAGGARFADQVRARIAGPLGMATLQPDYHWLEIPHRATGYRRLAGKIVRSTDTDVSWKLAGGGFISTVGDLARFGAGLARGELVGAEARELMWTPARTSDGKPTRYGLGFGIGALDGQRKIAHSGSQEKARTLLVLLPERKLGIALMTNSEWAQLGPLGDAMLRALAE